MMVNWREQVGDNTMPNPAQIATYNFIRSEIARLRGPQSHVPLALDQVTPLADDGNFAAFRVNGALVLVKPSGKVDDAGLPDCPTYANRLLSGLFLPAIAADLLSRGNPHKPFLHSQSHTPESFVAYLQHGTVLGKNKQNESCGNRAPEQVSRVFSLAPNLGPEKPEVIRASMSRIPGKEKFLAGIAAYDGDNYLYFDALRNLQAKWGDPAKMANAIWPWLRSWHAPFYRWGNGDPNAIAYAIKQNIEPLSGLRSRTIATLCAADEPPIRNLFWAFSKGTGRTNSKGFQPSSVGAAKVLHLLSPGFLPLWDNKISDYYRCEQDAFGYSKFCRMMKQFAASVQPYLGETDDRSLLKRIDEFNYSSITNGHNRD
jgi:hypothetical protein